MPRPTLCAPAVALIRSTFSVRQRTRLIKGVKFDLGWGIYPEPYGALPVQPEQFPTKYLRLKVPLTTAMNSASPPLSQHTVRCSLSVGYSLQSSLNAEEGLYWFHLMRAVKQVSRAAAAHHPISTRRARLIRSQAPRAAGSTPTSSTRG